MFALNPDDNKGGGGTSSKVKSSFIFFGKLGVYFVAIRAAHVYLGSSSSE